MRHKLRAKSGMRCRGSHPLDDSGKARRVSFIVNSYIVVRSPEGQRVAMANDERRTIRPHCQTGTAEVTQRGMSRRC